MVKDLDAFKASITATHDVTALEAAIAEAEAEDSADYTSESWAGFQAAIDSAKAVVNDLKGKSVLYKASTATASIAGAIDALEAAKAALVPGEPVDPPSSFEELFGDNYIMISDYPAGTPDEDLPHTWGYHGADAPGTLTNDSGTPSLDKSAVKLPFEEDGKNAFHVYADYDEVPAGTEAEALVFWYSLPYSRTDETGTGNYPVYLNITTSDGKAHNWTPATFLRPGSETESTTDSHQNFTLNTWGYVIIEAKYLVDINGSGETFDISDIVNIDIQAAKGETVSAANTGGKTLYIDDLGVVKDLEAFKEKVRDLINPSYTVQPLEPDGDITVDATFEGTFVNAEWNALEGAYRYFVNLYTVDGDQYTYVKNDATRRQDSTISGLTVSTQYAIQVLALDTDDNILSASNVFTFTTLAEDVPEYMNGPLPYDETMTANDVTVSGSNATVTWDWIDGVQSYTVYLYSVENGEEVYLTSQTADFEQGSVTFTGLDTTKEYLAQVVAYDISESIIFAYTPKAFNFTDNNGGTKDPVDTGRFLPAGIWVLTLGALAAVVITRKRTA